MPNRGSPTPPIALPDGVATTRFAPAVEVSDEVLKRLGDVCASVSVDDAVRTEAGRDWWPLAMIWALHGEVPGSVGAVARPASAAEVAGVLRVCNDARIPVTTAAGRSGVCGASVPAFGGVVLDMTGLTGVVAVDDVSLLLDVRAGTFGDVLEDELRGTHNVTLGHWPQSVELSTVGGWVACRGAGQYSTRYGKIEDMVVGLEVALADGRVIRTGGAAPRAAAGPDLSQLFVGSEGTLGVVTEARLRIHPLPAYERRAAYGFASFADGLEVCRRILRRGATPAVLRLYDERESRRYQEGTNALLVLDEGDPAIVDAVMSVVTEECAGAEVLDVDYVEQWMHHRNDVSALETAIRQDIVVDTTEIAARWAALPAIYVDAVAALKAVPGMWVASAHQSHAYTDGACVYFTWAGQPVDGPNNDGAVESFYNAAWDAVTTTVLGHGGALSHHHGVGINRGRFMRPALGQGLDVLASVKQALDPNGILNPGKLGLPSPFGPTPWP
ncbi:MAG TPA: FAD-binding oxidoreductase [Acidimicrobiales bacterium]|nr:FAD-binding oxidoreductase [Acidimicrobiales bacterium]